MQVCYFAYIANLEKRVYGYHSRMVSPFLKGRTDNESCTEKACAHHSHPKQFFQKSWCTGTVGKAMNGSSLTIGSEMGSQDLKYLLDRHIFAVGFVHARFSIAYYANCYGEAKKHAYD
jgi:hypothetical protein